MLDLLGLIAERVSDLITCGPSRSVPPPLHCRGALPGCDRPDRSGDRAVDRRRQASGCFARTDCGQIERGSEIRSSLNRI